jgi:P27 family predicted phage terminase small subunit
MKGRKPKPTKTKELAGNPGKRPLNKREPKPAAGVPVPPADCPERIRDLWTQIVAVLPPGVVTLADSLALLMLAGAAADFIAYRNAAPPGTDVLASDDGNAYWNLVAAARDKAEARLRSLLAEFGLTPSSRSRLVSTTTEGPPSGKARFFKNI